MRLCGLAVSNLSDGFAQIQFSLKKKKCSASSNYQTLSSPSLSLPFHGTLKNPLLFLTVFFLSLHSSYSSSYLPNLSFPASLLALLPLTFTQMVVVLRVPSLISTLFIYVSSLRSHILLQLQNAIHGVGDKPQMYMFMPYIFTEFQMFSGTIGISACFSQTSQVQNVPNST